MKREKKVLLWVGLLLCWICFSQCTDLPDYPTGSPCTFTITEPSGFSQCKTTHTGNIKIKILVNIVSKFYDVSSPNNRLIDFDDKQILVDPSVTPFPVTLVVNVPNTGITYVTELNIVGEECSECANGASDIHELPHGACSAAPPNTTTNPWTYLAARPRWSGRASFTYHPTETLGSVGHITNVPSTCAYCVSQ